MHFLPVSIYFVGFYKFFDLVDPYLFCFTFGLFHLPFSCFFFIGVSVNITQFFSSFLLVFLEHWILEVALHS